MSNFYKTYVLNTGKTLHSWNISNGIKLPCNDSLFDKKLVRAPEAPADSVAVWEISKPEHTWNGEAFSLMVKICLTKNKIAALKTPEQKYKAKTRNEALDWFCKTAGLVKMGACYATPVKDIYIHGIVDVNTFVINGTFKVVDEALFEKAYNFGIGGRKTYGCGMIVAI